MCGREGDVTSGSSSAARAALSAAPPTSPSSIRAEVLIIAALDWTELVPSASGPGSVPRSAARTSASTSSGWPSTRSIQARARHSSGSDWAISAGSAWTQVSNVISSPRLTKSSQLAAINSEAAL